MHQAPQPPSRKISPVAAAMMSTPTAAGGESEALAAILREARTRIQGQMTPAQIQDPSAEDLALADSIIRPLVENALRQARSGGGLPLACLRGQAGEPDTLVRQMMDEIFGFGPLAPYLADEGIEEVIVNGPADVWIIHAERGKERTAAAFRTAAEVLNFVNRAAGATAGRWMDKSNPRLDARMRDGSRLHALMSPLTVNVPIAVTIRRHRLVARTLEDLTRLGTITPQVEAFLRMAVQGRLNVIVAGSTASGKTNFTNALCAAADDRDRIVVVEDNPELQIAKPDVVQLTTRAQAEQARAFSIADLVVEALRMRPDRIITGEARGAEVVDILMAANTGHDGQMLTVHANSTRDVIQRLETMVLLRGVDVPLLAIRRQIADAFQLIVFLKRVFIGQKPRRFVTEIAEVQPSQFMEEDRVVVQNVFADKGQGLSPTGYFPERLARRLAENGVRLTNQFFKETGR
jgi:pilus assembly protein CpaF